MDCGPTCLRMISKWHGKRISLDKLRQASQYSSNGVSLLGLAEAAEGLGLRAKGVKVSVEDMINDIPLPAILHWNQYHFVVLTPASTRKNIVIADPAKGMITLSKNDFIANWVSTGGQKQLGIALVLEPAPAFYEQEDGQRKNASAGVYYSVI